MLYNRNNVENGVKDQTISKSPPLKNSLFDIFDVIDITECVYEKIENIVENRENAN